MGRCGSELQRSFGISLRQGQISGTFQRERDTTPVPQARKDFQGFLAGGMRGQMISLRTRDVSQICEGSRRPPRIIGIPEGGESAFIQSTRGG